MKLDQYLVRTGMTGREFAKMIGRDPSQVSRLRRGLQGPLKETLCAIVRKTKRKVQPNDIFPCGLKRKRRKKK